MSFSGKPLTLWSLAHKFYEYNTFHDHEFDLYVIVSTSDATVHSCPIKLSDMLLEGNDDDNDNDRSPLPMPATPRYFPVVFSSTDPPAPDVCLTFKKYDDHYYVIGVHDQPYPQLVFYNDCPATTVTVTNGFKYDTPVRFTAQWNWSYEIAAHGTSRLSFPEFALDGEGVTVYLAVASENPGKWCHSGMTVQRFAETTTKNETKKYVYRLVCHGGVKRYRV